MMAKEVFEAQRKHVFLGTLSTGLNSIETKQIGKNKRIGAEQKVLFLN